MYTMGLFGEEQLWLDALPDAQCYFSCDISVSVVVIVI